MLELDLYCSFIVGIDECLSSPCVHGTCVDEYLKYICNCEAGYTGAECSGRYQFQLTIRIQISVFQHFFLPFLSKGHEKGAPLL